MLERIRRLSLTDKTDPLVLNWALSLIKKKKLVAPAEAQVLENAFAAPQTVERIIDRAEPILINKALRVLSPTCFTTSIDGMIRKWPAWKPTLRLTSGPVIAELDPARAATLFKSCLASKASAVQDLVMSVLACLHPLPKARATVLFDESLRILTHSRDLTEVGDFVLRIVLKAAVAIDYRLATVLRGAFLCGREKTREEYAKQIDEWMLEMHFSLFDVELIDQLMADEAAVDKNALAVFYGDATTVETIVALSQDLKRRRYASIVDFVDAHCDSSGDNPMAATIRRLAQDSAFLEGLHKKKQRPYFFKMLLAVAMQIHRRKRSDFNSLDIPALVRLLTLDLPWDQDPRLLAQVSASLKRRHEEDGLLPLMDALERSLGTATASPILAVISNLNDDRLIAPLLHLITLPAAVSHTDTIVAVLIPYGDKAVDHLSAMIEDVPDAHFSAVLSLLEAIASPAAIAVLDAHFDRFWQAVRAELLFTLQQLPDGAWRDRLKPLVDKGQVNIDKAYLLSTIITDSMTDEDRSLLDRFNVKQLENDAKLESVMAGDVGSFLKGPIDILLRCGSCGEPAFYAVHNIFINPAANKTPYIGDPLVCIHCAKESTFKVTDEGYPTITALLIGLMMIHDDAARKAAMETCPLKLLPVMVQGRPMDIGDGIDLYQRQMEDDPDNPESIIGLANIYRNTGQSEKAAGLYRQAIQLAPDYIECYHNLAELAKSAGNLDEALNLLEQGMPFLDTARLKDAYNSTTVEHMRTAYLFFYDSLKNPETHTALQTTQAPVSIDEKRAAPKINRNAPCPCGSGKKYKKCCLNASAS